MDRQVLNYKKVYPIRSQSLILGKQQELLLFFVTLEQSYHEQCIIYIFINRTGLYKKFTSWILLVLLHTLLVWTISTYPRTGLLPLTAALHLSETAATMKLTAPLRLHSLCSHLYFAYLWRTQGLK